MGIHVNKTAEYEADISPKVQALREECEKHGVSCLILVQTTRDKTDVEDGVEYSETLQGASNFVELSSFSALSLADEFISCIKIHAPLGVSMPAMIMGLTVAEVPFDIRRDEGVTPH